LPAASPVVIRYDRVQPQLLVGVEKRGSMNTVIPRRKFLASCAAGAFLARPVIRAADQLSGDEPVRLTNESQLFLDESLIASTLGMERVVHRPAKQGLIREADGAPWERGDAPSVVRDRNGRFHLYYRFLWEDPSVRDLHPGIGNDKAHWFRRTVGYAVSDDGIHWSKPVLGLFAVSYTHLTLPTIYSV